MLAKLKLKVLGVYTGGIGAPGLSSHKQTPAGVAQSALQKERARAERALRKFLSEMMHSSEMH